jgi:hypothetical protein
MRGFFMSEGEHVSNDAMKRQMQLIQALDSEACVKFSTYTGQWYVVSNLEIGDGHVLHGGAEHRDSPEEAVSATLQALQGVTGENYVAGRYLGERREWRWNGAAFAECTRSVVIEGRKKALA